MTACVCSVVATVNETFPALGWKIDIGWNENWVILTSFDRVIVWNKNRFNFDIFVTYHDQ